MPQMRLCPRRSRRGRGPPRAGGSRGRSAGGPPGHPVKAAMNTAFRRPRQPIERVAGDRARRLSDGIQRRIRDDDERGIGNPIDGGIQQVRRVVEPHLIQLPQRPGFSSLLLRQVAPVLDFEAPCATVIDPSAPPFCKQSRYPDWGDSRRERSEGVSTAFFCCNLQPKGV